ncbi:Translin-associated protein X-like protein [Smittium culicis]|uniref:Translin-associated protein X-like protein n=1 Tax=Smittium culicis TaxID=133412 RepID=A0A1R1YHU3_9FUNG|nr:Translin-associated protein X-like protein [Smittium culicis]
MANEVEGDFTHFEIPLHNLPNGENSMFGAGNFDHITPDVQKIFEAARVSMDLHYGIREDMIKKSRDIVTLSKKAIFSLHRTNLNTETPNFNATKKQIEAIIPLFIEMYSLTAKQEIYRYYSIISGALQEFIEAVTFMEFLEKGLLLSKDEILSRYFSNEGGAVFIDDKCYILGILDLPGEITRFAIKCSTENNVQKVSACLEFLRNLSSSLLALNIPRDSKKFSIKLTVLDSSIQKIELCSFSLSIRQKESMSLH